MKDTNDPNFDTESVYSTVSRDIVKYLRGQGRTLDQIGKSMGLSESFVSRVLNGERSFTLKHLAKLEKVLKKPLPLILLESADPNSAPAELRTIYEAFRGVMAALGGVSPRGGESLAALG
jgi:transcriptional regulator with XRE-family HTH domain